MGTRGVRTPISTRGFSNTIPCFCVLSMLINQKLKTVMLAWCEPYECRVDAHCFRRFSIGVFHKFAMLSCGNASVSA